MRIRLRYDPSTAHLVGAATIVTADGERIPVEARVNLRAIAREAARRFVVRERAAVDGEVGFGFLKRAWKKAWAKVKKVVKAVGKLKIVRKITNAAKKAWRFAGKIVRSPAFATAIGVVSAVVPGVGPAIGAGYAGVRAAMSMVDRVAAGDPKAIASATAYVKQSPKVAALLKSVQPANLPVPPAANPWLQGLGNLI